LLNDLAALAEGEDLRLDACIEECDLERAVHDRPGLTHQLMEPGWTSFPGPPRRHPVNGIPESGQGQQQIANETCCL
jgi:hypothetical protein